MNSCFKGAKPSAERADDDADERAVVGYRSPLSMLAGFVGHAEQNNLQMRRYGCGNVPYGGSAG